MARLTGSEPIRWGRTRSSAVFARLERSLRMNGYVDLAGKPLPDAATTGTSISITPSVASIPLGAADAVLVVPPYNAHVNRLAAALPDGTRVGTVERFQGQQGHVVIY